MNALGKTAEERVKSYHKTHFEWISKAIDADEENDTETAVQCYIRGLELANMGLQEVVEGNSHIAIRARHLQDKMRQNREREIDRLEFLLSSKLKKDKIMRSSSVENLDKTDLGKPSFFNKSLRDKKSSKKENETPKLDSKPRSNSTTNINKITTDNSNTESNLAKALQSLNNAPKKPLTTKTQGVKPTSTGISNRNTAPNRTNQKRPNIPNSNRNSGPPKPKLSTAISTEENVQSDKKNINKESILSKLKNVDRQCIETILNEVLDNKTVKFDDIAGNDHAKQCLLETVIYPRLRPELFTGLRAPARGIMLFGPPGNGKTLLAKAVANESRCTFFNISAASLMSKWVGEGEKMVRALFAVAREVAPSVIFLDEVDALLASRGNDGDGKSHTRRMLTQFLQEIDGAGTDENQMVLCMAATNRPDELDDAALRRFQKKIYIRMPDTNARKTLLRMLLKHQPCRLKESEIDKLAELTKFYSSSDLTNLAKCAAMVPIREMPFERICSVTVESMRPIKFSDFTAALKQIKPSLSQASLVRYDKWNEQYGDNS